MPRRWKAASLWQNDEILRMKDFASIAENPFDSDELISQIQSAYEIEIDDENQEDDDYV